MNKLKSTMLVGAGVATIGIAGVGVAQTSAAMSGDAKTNTSLHVDRNVAFDAALSTALASKFNLDKSEIKSVIDEVRQTQKDTMNEKRLEALKQALSEDTITQDQYDYVVDELAVIDTLRESLKDADEVDRAEIVDQMQTKYKELRSWMKDEDISTKLIGGGFGWNHHSNNKSEVKYSGRDDSEDRS